MNEYLKDLLARMLDVSDKKTQPDGSKTISWKACRESEKLTNKDFIPQLIEIIDKEKDKEKRNKAYFILGKIAKNTNDLTATKYLIGRINKEKDKNVLSTLLHRISDLYKPKDMNIQPIINAINHNDSQVKSSAILALEHTDNPLAEDTLIDLLENPESTDSDLVFANAALANIGTKKSISILTKLVTHKKIDVAGSALNTIIKISDETCLPLCLEQLENGNNKSIALEGVVKYGNENVIPHIINRIKELVDRKRKRGTLLVVERKLMPELVVGLEFLKKYAEKGEVESLFGFILTKKYDLLFDDEKEWLNNNISTV